VVVFLDWAFLVLGVGPLSSVGDWWSDWFGLSWCLAYVQVDFAVVRAVSTSSLFVYFVRVVTYLFLICLVGLSGLITLGGFVVVSDSSFWFADGWGLGG